MVRWCWADVVFLYLHQCLLAPSRRSRPTACNSCPHFFLRSSRIGVDLLLYESKSTDKREQYGWRAGKNLDGLVLLGENLVIPATCEVGGRGCSLVRFQKGSIVKGPGMVLGYLFMVSQPNLSALEQSWLHDRQ